MLDGKCVREKTAVKTLLEGNEMTMTQLVTDRAKVLYKLNQMGIVWEKEVIIVK